MAILSREAMVTPSDLKHETVHVGPFGGEVILQEFSLGERLRILKSFRAVDADDEEAATRALVGLAVASLRNEDLTPMFPPEEWSEAVDALMARGGAGVTDLIDETRRVQGMSEEAVKEAVGNSEASRSEPSSSGSPETSDTPASAP